MTATIPARAHNRVRRAIATVSFLAGLGLTVAGATTATAATTPLAATASAANSQAAPGPISVTPASAACHVTPKRGVGPVIVRARPTTHSTRLSQINPGQHAVASCTATHGAVYHACGGTAPWWIKVRWNSHTGYVAWRCVRWTRG
jgi:hypothetical protein